jgi:SAM-dependent methyltransferase
MIDPVILRDWPTVNGNPKNAVLVRRRRNALRSLPRYRRELDMILKLVGAAPGRVLDIACGVGFRVVELAQAGHEAHGLDIDPNLCRLTAAGAERFELPARITCGDACRIPFADGSFDVVMSNSFFEHVYDIDTALNEQIRVLKPGGLLIIEDGNFLNPLLLLDLLVFYAIRTRGRHGGLKWLFTKGRVRQNLYGYLPLGRDEDVKTMWWWRRKLASRTDLVLLESVTTAKHQDSWLPLQLYPFRGLCLALARRAIS